MNKNERFNWLLQQYLSNKVSAAEHDEFFELLASHRYDSILSHSIQQDLAKGFDNAAADLPPHIAQEIVRNIYTAEKKTAEIIPVQSKSKKIWRWVAAASVILIAASVYFIAANKNNHGEKDQFASLIPAATITKENVTNAVQQVLLSDGSTVTLKPKGIIHYPQNFKPDSREVYLEGEAFFQVTKNPEKPFLVYYRNIVTKVLGTSFNINTNPQTGNVEVAVKTGRVQVSENEKIVKGNLPVNSVIVTPNQKAVYQVEKGILATAIVDTPEPLQDNRATMPTKVQETFIYEQESLAAIFEQLEKAYGIEIIVANPNLNNCVFTGDVSSQDLFTKLKIICLTTNASYEVNGTKILVKGKGCN
jgi:ferric-dicitrate binding protein FerR (iron transport regulator)